MCCSTTNCIRMVILRLSLLRNRRVPTLIYVFCLMLEIKVFRGYETGKWKGRQSNTGHFWLELQVLCHVLTHDNWTTTNHHNPLRTCTAQVVLSALLHTWQPLNMCCQNSVRGWPENSIHQERTHAELFCHSKCSEHFVSCWKRRKLDCEGRWLSSCCDPVAENWQLKPELSWVRLPAFSLSSIFAS